ncbi:glycosyltransferase [Allobaculum mucilyticum]|uniref:glycosyltransferase n=1 Tax=Allobaculum mucilyticum TaxID=2834459 RepID=UPI001E540C3F|nr:RecX family transcriptional regulator [Allobaculum mucilyticum]UNT95100.1 RecX family transcriptional regulator [Allobaculum mucilyticum]
MRIGLVTDTYLPDVNGVVSSTVTLKNAFEKLGHTVFVITNHAGSRIEYEDGILRLPGFRLKSLYGYKVSSPINMGAMKYIEGMHLDILHLQTNFGVGLYGQHLAKALAIPVVDTYHTMYTDYTHYINPRGYEGIERVSVDAIKAASRKVCNSVQAVVAPSEKTRDALLEYGVLAPIYVIPTGLDLSKFTDIDPDDPRLVEIRSRVSSDPDDVILVFVGRLAKEKSLEMPIEAVARSKNPHIKLAVVGDGPDAGYYQNLVSSLGAEDRVTFLGLAKPEDIGAYYKAFDAFVSASLSETQGMTYLEALAAGKMIFGRRDDVLDGLLDEGKSGFYFDSPDELNEKIEALCAMSEEQKQEAAAYCSKKIAPFTSENFASSMELVYRQAIEDYSQTFEVEKIQFSGDYALLKLCRDSSDEPVRLLLPMEDFFDLKISLHTRLDAYMVRSYLDLQDFYWCVYKVKNRLHGRDMTRKQVIDYCVLKLGATVAVATQAANELETAGLIDDEKFAKDKADYYQSCGLSRRQVQEKLYKAGIERELILEACQNLSEDKERSNASQMARRLAKSIRTKSRREQQRTIVQKLLSRGYSVEAAREAAEDLVFDEDYDSNALNAAFAKACRLYASRPPEQKRYRIRTYCLRQGFEREDIDALLESENI